MKPVLKKLTNALPKLSKAAPEKKTSTARSGTIHIFMRMSQILSVLSNKQWRSGRSGRSTDGTWDEERFVGEYAGEIVHKLDGDGMPGKAGPMIEVRKSVEVESVSCKT